MAKRSNKIEAPKSTAQQLGSLIKSCRDIMRKDKGLNGDLDRLPMLTWIMFLKFLDDMEQVREEESRIAGKRFRPAIEAPYRWRDWAAKTDGGITGPELLAFINQDEAVRPDGKRGAGLFAYLRSLESTNGDRRDIIAKVFENTMNRMGSGYLLRDVINKVNDIHFTSRDEIHTLGQLYESMLREMRDAAGDSGEFYTPRAVVKFVVTAIDPRLGETVLDPAAGTGGFLAEAFEHLTKQCKKAEDINDLQHGTLRGIEPKTLPYLLCQMNLLLHGLEYPEIDPGNALRFPLREIGDRDRVDVIMTNPPFGGEEERGILSNFPEDRRTSETALLFLQLIMRKLTRPTATHFGRAAVVVPESVMSDPGVAARVRRNLVSTFNLHTVVRLPRGVFEPYSDIQTNILFFDTRPSSGGTWFYQHEVPSERQAMRNPCYTQTYPLTFDELGVVVKWFRHPTASDRAWYVNRDTIEAQGFTLDFRNPRRLLSDAGNPTAALASISLALQSAQHSVTSLSALVGKLRRAVHGGAAPVVLHDLLTRYKEEAVIAPSRQYKQITVRLYGKGVSLRGTMPGSEIKTRPQFVARQGQLIMSRIDARNGAFGIVPEELDGAVVTQDFPLFSIDSSRMRPEYFALLVNSTEFLDACKRASKGTTNRKRLREELLLSQWVFVPRVEYQDKAIDAARSIADLRRALEAAQGTTDAMTAQFADYLASGDGE